MFYAVIGFLYYLLKRQRERSILHTIHSSNFSMTDQSANHRFIINYFTIVKAIYRKSYCIKQKKVTECVPCSEHVKAERMMLKCQCAECGITKTKFQLKINFDLARTI